MSLLAAVIDDDRHYPGDGHPEQPDRLAAAASGLAIPAIRDAVVHVSPRWASLSELSRVHDSGYLDTLAELSAEGGGTLDPDTSVSRGSWATARLTAGAGLAAIDALGADGGQAAFVIGRPPGHHAGRDAGRGFCLLNNVAVAAASLTVAGERVAIIDWDVHHGNGTQEIFWSDPSVLYVSVHQWPLYPGTGRPEERGGKDGWGATVNLPLPAGATGDVYLSLFDEVIIPRVEEFEPTWVLVSAGFDAHRDDPLGDMGLTSGDFADIAGRCVSLAGRSGRLALFLEGGYDLQALRASVGACAARLIGATYRPSQPRTAGPG